MNQHQQSKQKHFLSQLINPKKSCYLHKLNKCLEQQNCKFQHSLYQPILSQFQYQSVETSTFSRQIEQKNNYEILTISKYRSNIDNFISKIKNLIINNDFRFQIILEAKNPQQLYLCKQIQHIFTSLQQIQNIFNNLNNSNIFKLDGLLNQIKQILTIYSNFRNIEIKKQQASVIKEIQMEQEIIINDTSAQNLNSSNKEFEKNSTSNILSQKICKFGSNLKCKYGKKCNFIHEDFSQNQSVKEQNNSNSSFNQKENSQQFENQSLLQLLTTSNLSQIPKCSLCQNESSCCTSHFSYQTIFSKTKSQETLLYSELNHNPEDFEVIFIYQYNLDEFNLMEKIQDIVYQEEEIQTEILLCNYNNEQIQLCKSLCNLMISFNNVDKIIDEYHGSYQFNINDQQINIMSLLQYFNYLNTNQIQSSLNSQLFNESTSARNTYIHNQSYDQSSFNQQVEVNNLQSQITITQNSNSQISYQQENSNNTFINNSNLSSFNQEQERFQTPVNYNQNNSNIDGLSKIQSNKNIFQNNYNSQIEYGPNEDSKTNQNHFQDQNNSQQGNYTIHFIKNPNDQNCKIKECTKGFQNNKLNYHINSLSQQDYLLNIQTQNNQQTPNCLLSLIQAGQEFEIKTTQNILSQDIIKNNENKQQFDFYVQFEQQNYRYNINDKKLYHFDLQGNETIFKEQIELNQIQTVDELKNINKLDYYSVKKQQNL